MLKCRLADHANRANHADRALFAGEFRDFVLPRKISSCGVQNLETVHTLPKEEKGVHTWIMCKSQLKKKQQQKVHSLLGLQPLYSSFTLSMGM